MQLRDRIEILVEEMLDGRILLNEAMSEFEKIYIEKALKRHKDHLSNTAEVLGIHRNTLSKRVSHYQDNGSKTPKRLLKKKAR
jgi:DNA-binding NtrC family response regulator